MDNSPVAPPPPRPSLLQLCYTWFSVLRIERERKTCARFLPVGWGGRVSLQPQQPPRPRPPQRAQRPVLKLHPASCVPRTEAPHVNAFWSKCFPSPNEAVCVPLSAVSLSIITVSSSAVKLVVCALLFIKVHVNMEAGIQKTTNKYYIYISIYSIYLIYKYL